MGDAPYNMPDDAGGSATRAALAARVAAAARPDVQTGAGGPAPQLGEEAMGTIDPQAQAQAHQDQSWGTRTVHGILSALGGKFETQYIPTENGVVQQQIASTPGQQWKRIIAGALTGFGAAATAGTQGPGGALRGAGAGIQAGMAGRIAEDKRQQDLANTQFSQEQEAAMNNARRSMMAHQVTKMAFDLTEAQKQSFQSDATNEANLMKLLSEGKDEGAVDLGVKPTVQALWDAFNTDPTLHDKHAAGQIIPVAHVNAKGEFEGVHGIWVPQAIGDRKATTDITVNVPKAWDDKGNPTDYDHITFGKSTGLTVSQMADRQLAFALQGLDVHAKQVQTQHVQKETDLMDARQRAENAASAATARDANARARQTDAETDYFIAHGMLPGKESPKQEQEAYWGGGGWAGMKNFLNSPDVKAANQAENMYQAFMRAYQDHVSGHDDTGAPGMVAFSDHVGAVFGGKNIKMNKTLLQDHFDARSLSDDAVVFMQKFTNGDPISPKQWEAFKRTVEQNRDIQWGSVAREGSAQQRPLDRVGFPADLASKYIVPGTATTPIAGGGTTAPPVAGGGRTLTVNTDNLPTLTTLPPGAHLKKGSDGNQYVFNQQNQALGKYAPSNVPAR